MPRRRTSGPPSEVTPTPAAPSTSERFERALERAEAEMRDATATAEAILRAAVDGVVVIDSRGTIRSVNPAVEQIFGFAAEEMIGRNVKMLMPPPFHEEHDGYLANYLRTGRRKIIGIGREVVGQRKGGATFPMDLAVSEVALGDEVAFVGTIRDITERKRLERELRHQLEFSASIVETAPAIVLVLDDGGRIVQFNQYLEKLSGVALEQVRGKDWIDAFSPHGDPSGARDTFRRCLAGEPFDHGVVHPILSASGEPRSIEWHCRPLRAEDRVTGALAIGLDVTDRQALEMELRQAQKMEAIGRLAGGVAHDFNTILGSITGYCELLLSQSEESSLDHRQILQVRRSAERGAALTRQLLAFSRRRVLEPSTVDLNSAVTGMSDMLRRLIGEDVELEVGLESGLWPVYVDRNQIEQVVVNLVVNSRDAVRSGGRITVETRNLPGRKGDGEDPVRAEAVLLAVSDDGTGIDPADQEHIFEPFFTTKEPGKGTGLGLSMVYGTVQQSGGTISVESTPGEGSRVEIRLPRSAPALPTEASAEPDEGEARANLETILVVEDDEIFLQMMRETLEAHGYRVLTASKPSDALEIAQRTPPAALVTDVVMPETSGFELAERARRLCPDLKILMMSGYAEDSLKDRGLDFKDRAMLQKPFKSKVLLRTLHDLLYPSGDPGTGAGRNG